MVACNHKCMRPHVRYTLEVVAIDIMVVAFLIRTTQSSISSSSPMCWSKLFFTFIEVKHAAKVVFISELILFNWFCCFRIKNIINYANWIHFSMPHIENYTAAGRPNHAFHYAPKHAYAVSLKTYVESYAYLVVALVSI